MKAYTDINQSKKLAEILPLESADMYYWYDGSIYYLASMDDGDFVRGKDIAAWSLSALLDVINENYYTTLFHDGVAWNIDVIHHDDVKVKFNRHADYPVNACYEMIIKLHKEKLL